MEKRKNNEGFFKVVIIAVIILFIGQLLFGGWGNGIINKFFNKPEILVIENLIVYDEAEELMLVEGKDREYTFKEAIRGDPSAVASIQVVGTNFTHCILNWLRGSNLSYVSDISVLTYVATNINETPPSSIELCEEDCLDIQISLRSNNYKDVEGLYGKFCWNNDYMIVGDSKEDTPCLIVEEDFIHNLKEIDITTTLKILNLEQNETVQEYIKKNEESLYPTKILLKDKSHKSLPYKQIKMITQDILNCKTY